MHFPLHHDLCEINRPGTVPVLAANTREESLTDSLDITVFLAERYLPPLTPAHLADQIRRLRNEVHDMNYFSLTHTRKEHRVAEMQGAMKAAFSNPHLWDRHRRALEANLEDYVIYPAPLIFLSQNMFFLSSVRNGIRDTLRTINTPDY